MALWINNSESSTNKINCGTRFSSYSGPFTMCCWINVDSTGTFNVGNPNYMGTIDFGTSGGARFIMLKASGSQANLMGQMNGNGSNVQGSHNFNGDTGKWIFIAYSYQPSARQTLYYRFIGDATLTQDAQKTSGVPASITSTTNPFLLGNRSDGSANEAMNGRMAHPRLYYRELTMGEIDYISRRPVMPGGRGELQGFVSGWILDNVTVAIDVNNYSPGICTVQSISNVPDPFDPREKASIATRIAQYAAIGASYTITIAQGAYTLTGEAISNIWHRLMAVTQGVYSLTGEAVTLTITKGIAAVTGIYTLTGEAVTMRIKAWTFRTRHDATWSERTKNNATWSNRARNAANWIFRSKD